MPIIDLGIIIALIILIIIYCKRRKIVLEKSERIKTLLELNSTIQYRTVRPHYFNVISCQSKSQFDKLDLDEYLISEIATHETFYRGMIEPISQNWKEYKDYLNRVEKIVSTATEDYCRSFGFPLSRFLKYEKCLFKEKQLRKPQLDIFVYCKATYTSPQGRNSYQKQKRYDYGEMRYLLNQFIERKKTAGNKTISYPTRTRSNDTVFTI